MDCPWPLRKVARPAHLRSSGASAPGMRSRPAGLEPATPGLERAAELARAGDRERGRPTGRGGVPRDHGFSLSTRWGCSRAGPASG